jgi:hypothetical protein
MQEMQRNASHDNAELIKQDWENTNLPAITSGSGTRFDVLLNDVGSCGVVVVATVVLVAILFLWWLGATNLGMALLTTVLASDAGIVARLVTLPRHVALSITVGTDDDSLVGAIALAVTSLATVVARDLWLGRALTGDLKRLACFHKGEEYESTLTVANLVTLLALNSCRIAWLRTLLSRMTTLSTVLACKLVLSLLWACKRRC